jgi:hypothetical protein
LLLHRGLLANEWVAWICSLTRGMLLWSPLQSHASAHPKVPPRLLAPCIAFFIALMLITTRLKRFEVVLNSVMACLKLLSEV